MGRPTIDAQSLDHPDPRPDPRRGFQPGLRPASRPPSPAGHDFADDLLALRPALLAFARRLARSEADAEDLVQETLARAFGAQARFRPGTNLKSWLFTILKNRFNTGYVRARRQVPMEPELIEAALAAPATQVSDLWAAEAIRRLLDDLTPAHREVLILIPVLGLPYEDVAEVCGCSVGTIKSRLNRARRALGARMEERRS